MAATTVVPLRQRAAWRALADHHAGICDRHLRELFAADPERGERLAVEAAGLYLDYSKHRVTDETLRLLVALAEESGLRERHRRDVPRRADQHDRGPRRAARRAAGAARASIVRRRRRRRRRACTRCSTGWARSPSACAAARWRGHTGQRDPRDRQHRHRRLRPRAGHGLRGAAALQRARADVPLRLERRRHRLRRGDARPRSRPRRCSSSRPRRSPRSRR